MKNTKDIKTMFGSIAGRYDLLNRLISLGMDQRWRRYLIKWACITGNQKVLDAGTGTGDIAIEVVKTHSLARVTGLDLTAEMIIIGSQRPGGASVSWCLGDAQVLPFPDNTFDVVLSGFLARNVPDLSQTLREQVRVVKPGGRVLCLDTSPVPDNILKPLTLFYLKQVIPVLGQLIAGKKKEYTYLPSSTINFIPPEKIAMKMRHEGLEQVGFKSFMFGNISIHRGEKPLHISP